jgi:hypothetical protein
MGYRIREYWMKESWIREYWIREYWIREYWIREYWMKECWEKEGTSIGQPHQKSSEGVATPGYPKRFVILSVLSS